jgi:hypothetical protein
VIIACKDTEKREQNKINSFIFYAECQYLRQLVGKDKKSRAQNKETCFFFLPSVRIRLRFELSSKKFALAKRQSSFKKQVTHSQNLKTD